MLHRVKALARIMFLDGVRRHALIGIVSMALAAEVFGLLFMDFFGRDVGRASSDYLFSVMWMAGLLFLFFHSVQVISWDEERGAIYALLSRPISRAEYVLGVFVGLAALLFSLLLLLGPVAYVSLIWIKQSLASVYFPELSIAHFLLAWAGILAMQLVILAVIMLFSGLVRGGFPVLLLSASYYAICSGLPVVRASAAQHDGQGLDLLLQLMTALFPDFGRLDYKDEVVAATLSIDTTIILTNFSVAILYVCVMVSLACWFYARRDLQ
ncbi:MAG: hypothetical protein R8K46_08085 [Mariprofundaceae bacterium]